MNDLKSIEIGGPRGRTLTAGLRQLHVDFDPHLQKFFGRKLSLLNIDEGLLDFLANFQCPLDEAKFSTAFFELRLQVSSNPSNCG